MTDRRSRPTVAFVSSHAELGGSELYLLRLIDALGREVDPHLVSLADGPLVQRAIERGIPVTVVPTGRRIGLVTGAVRLSRALRPVCADVIHANGVKAALVLALRRGRHPAPVVWVKHDHSRDGLLGFMVARRVARVVGVSRSVLRSLPASGSAQVIPPGVTLTPAAREESRASVRASLGAPVHAPLLLCLGRLDRAKGYDDAIRTLAAVASELDDVVLAVVGGADPQQAHLRHDLTRLAGELGIGERVHLLGHRDDVAPWLAAADVLLVTSRAVARSGMGQEGFGLVAAEALLAGKPVAGFAAGALPEVVGECGALVRPGDVVGLAAAVVDILRDGSRRDSMRACGMERGQRFGVRVWRDAMLTIYGELAPSADR
jgi:glycosyltransferase involved in cell wall biosynthesis